MDTELLQVIGLFSFALAGLIGVFALIFYLCKKNQIPINPLNVCLLLSIGTFWPALVMFICLACCGESSSLQSLDCPLYDAALNIMTPITLSAMGIFASSCFACLMTVLAAILECFLYCCKFDEISKADFIS